MTKLSKSSNPVFFNTARNLIHGELSLLPRHFVFPTVSHRGERETRVTGEEAQGTSGELLYQVTIEGVIEGDSFNEEPMLLNRLKIS